MLGFRPSGLKGRKMERDGDEIHVTETEASAGSQPRVVRYVLGISLLLVVVLMSAIWIIGSATV